MSTYPLPGSLAEALLEHVRANPGCSKTSATSSLGVTASSAARYVDKLVRHGRLWIETDSRGHHALWAADTSTSGLLSECRHCHLDPERLALARRGLRLHEHCCAACGREVFYHSTTDSYYHLDGSANLPCWVRYRRGEFTPEIAQL
jgi:hypothetical protein